MNLLAETRAAIAESGHTVEDITFIGSRNGEYACTWDEFGKIADVVYDAGYGWQEVATDLVIRFGDGTEMDRSEYDGSESWEIPLPPKGMWQGETKPITKLIEGGWNSLADMNKS